MRVFVAPLALSLTLMAAPRDAQAAQAPAPAPAGQKPPAPAPAPAQALPAAPVVPFGAGLKYAYIDLQAIAATSNEGKAFNAKVQAFQEQKVKDLQDRNKALQASQEKLEKGASVMNDTARAQLQSDIERQQRDLQRATEDAQQEVQRLLQQVQGEFEQRLAPIIDRVAKEKQLHFVFNAQDSGLAWADPSLNLTADVIKALDSGAGAKPASAPAAPGK